MVEKIFPSWAPSHDRSRALSEKQRVMGNGASTAPQSRKELPRVEPLGRIRINFVKIYSRDLVMKAHADNGDKPELFIDLEHAGRGGELHFGISADFRFEPWRYTEVKPHIDIYIPASEIPRLREMLARGDFHLL